MSDEHPQKQQKRKAFVKVISLLIKNVSSH